MLFILSDIVDLKGLEVANVMAEGRESRQFSESRSNCLVVSRRKIFSVGSVVRAWAGSCGLILLKPAYIIGINAFMRFVVRRYIFTFVFIDIRSWRLHPGSLVVFNVTAPVRIRVIPFMKISSRQPFLHQFSVFAVKVVFVPVVGAWARAFFHPFKESRL